MCGKRAWWDGHLWVDQSHRWETIQVIFATFSCTFSKDDLIFRVARDLLLEPQSPTELQGPVQFVHQWLDMSQVAKLLKYWQNHSKKQKQQAYFLGKSNDLSFSGKSKPWGWINCLHQQASLGIQVILYLKSITVFTIWTSVEVSTMSSSTAQLCCGNDRRSGGSELHTRDHQGERTLGLSEGTPGTSLSWTESNIVDLHLHLKCKAGHVPKPILLNTGEYYIPFQWHPIHIDTQVLTYLRVSNIQPKNSFYVHFSYSGSVNF